MTLTKLALIALLFSGVEALCQPRVTHADWEYTEGMDGTTMEIPESSNWSMAKYFDYVPASYYNSSSDESLGTSCEPPAWAQDMSFPGGPISLYPGEGHPNENHFGKHPYREYWHLDGVETVEIVRYVDSSDVGCQNMDTNYETAQWEDMGEVQLPQFGAVPVTCAAGQSGCVFEISEIEKSQSAMEINLERGGDARAAGRVGVFSYLGGYAGEFSGQNGTPGTGGKNDIEAFNHETEKYCARIKDAVSDGLYSEYASSPVVDFMRIKWRAADAGQSQNDGSEAPEKPRGSALVQGLDGSMLEWLKESLSIPKEEENVGP